MGIVEGGTVHNDRIKSWENKTARDIAAQILVLTASNFFR
jgi:hypothetical protein